MMEIFWDALNDSLRAVPFLLIIYIGIELIEYKYGDQIREWVGKAGKSGPIVGAISGGFPQCGFSVVATALYTQRLVTMGTLLAVYLSTSDEAIPIILSRPESMHLIWPIIGTKIVIALVAGFVVDFIFKKEQHKTVDHIEAVIEGHDSKSHHHEVVLNEIACCGHSSSCKSKTFNVKEIFWHPIVHTANIFGFIFVTTLVLNILLSRFELTALDNVFVTALIGLIPNCAASVTITELYLNGTIGFASVISGLSASGGLGLLILWREEKNKKVFFKILGLLYVIAVIAGLVV
ncbi:MAG: putative manganese transporter [Candidatus Shapirobacteria bacterium]